MKANSTNPEHIAAMKALAENQKRINALQIETEKKDAQALKKAQKILASVSAADLKKTESAQRKRDRAARDPDELKLLVDGEKEAKRVKKLADATTKSDKLLAAQQRVATATATAANAAATAQALVAAPPLPPIGASAGDAAVAV